MSTSQAFRVALHVPYADPTIGQVVGVITPGDQYASGWQAGAAGGAFPDPNAAGQILVSGPGPDFVWTLSLLDAGTY